MKLSPGDKVKMKKAHPCGSFVWEILRTGVDLKLRCEGCGHMVMVPRSKIEKNIKEILGEKEDT